MQPQDQPPQLPQSQQGTPPLPIPARRESSPDVARLIVHANISYLDEQGRASTANIRFGGRLDSGEQPYIRNLTLKDEWVDVDLGWLASQPLSLLVVKCDSGALGVRDAVSLSMVWAVPAGLALIGTPNGSECKLQVKGPGKATITAIPK